MIQRIQSVFLLLIIVLSVLMFYAPIATITYGTNVYIFYPLPSLPTDMNALPFYYQVPVLIIFTAIFALIELLAYKKRPLQLKIGNFNNVLILLTVVSCFFYIDSLTQAINEVTGQDNIRTEYEWGIYIPFIQLVFNLFASRFIKKDEALIKSLDRIR